MSGGCRVICGASGTTVMAAVLLVTEPPEFHTVTRTDEPL